MQRRLDEQKRIEEEFIKQKELEEKKRIEDEQEILEEEKRKQEFEKIRKEIEDEKYVKGVVRFSNISVREIKKSDLIGKPDPYVIFKYGKESKKTSIGKNTTNYDYQDEEYELEFDPTKTEGKHDIDIEVYDYDSFSKDDYIGSINVEILPTSNNETQFELYLQPKKEKKEDSSQNKSEYISNNSDQKLGKVIFNMKYISEQELIKNYQEKELKISNEQEQNIDNFENYDVQLQQTEQQQNEEKILEEGKENVQEEDEEKENNEKETENLYVDGVVKFSKISVNNLPKMDLIGKTDPYIIFKLGDQQLKTSVAKNTQNYDYISEEYEIVYDPVIMNRKGKVVIQVWDYDSLSKNDLIGVAVVDILPSFKQPMHFELFIQPLKGRNVDLLTESDKLKLSKSLYDQKLGKVTFEMIYKPIDQRLKVRRNAMLESLKRKKAQKPDNIGMGMSIYDFVKGAVILKNINIRNLPQKYIDEYRDIYVLIMIGTKEKKSQIVKSSESVQMNEEIFIEFDPDEMKERNLFIEVWAKKDQWWDEPDEKNRFEFLGGVAIEFLEFCNKPQRQDLHLIANSIEQKEFIGDVSLDIVYLPDKQ
ncbi:MAG: hypothetical protein EZS28_019487 [Streblomastix strix]|uniref:C2 domain-containing protein n=1 Tax=Streblomastix strix TaxID=222440 RepID=A0A5J4VR46_9EUKA|nr:MAG: hypothetical protein EZS28_019487 [Streblomastix strix]